MLNKYIKNSLYAAALLGIATACEPEIERETPDYEQARGDADFSTYVALGNSLTSGYADGALNRTGQENSYPAIIAEKMEHITPGFEFDQPLLPEGRINGTLVLQEIMVGPPLIPVIVSESNGLSPAVIAQPVSGSFNNMGVPGAKVGDLTLPGYGSAQGNPYFARFASAPTATIVDDAVAQNPTFFTLWIGNNDVLGYATQGGEGTITEPSVFENKYRSIITQLVATNQSIEGALANIPSVSNIPYLRAVSWNRFGLDANQAAQINSAVEARIDPEIRKKVIYGVIEEGARRQIIAQVAPQVVYQQAYETAYAEAKDQGATDEQAAAIAKEAADNYVASEDGQKAIQGLQTNLIEKREPAEVHTIVEQNLQSAPVQSQIQENYEGALAADEAGQLEQALGEEGVAAVEANIVVQTDSLKSSGFYPTFAEGANGFVVDDPKSPTGIRQLSENDLVTLRVSSAPASEFNPTAGDITIPGKYVLDQQEQRQVMEAITAYNQIIAEVANENTFALVDMNGFFNQVVDGGITEGGTVFTNAFITGNAFSLDGVHLTQKGYALVARRFIEIINTYYKSEIPLPNTRNYPAVALP
jgi:predicted Fe-Mo cluster-binding NifX family protein